jgi:hypothetical protein
MRPAKTPDTENTVLSAKLGLAEVEETVEAEVVVVE